MISEKKAETFCQGKKVVQSPTKTFSLVCLVYIFLHVDHRKELPAYTPAEITTHFWDEVIAYRKHVVSVNANMESGKKAWRHLADPTASGLVRWRTYLALWSWVR